MLRRSPSSVSRAFQLLTPITRLSINSRTIRVQPHSSAQYLLLWKTSNRRSFHIESRRTSQTPFSSHNDTIYALSTAEGKAGIAVIRVSGRSCQAIYSQLCPGKPLPRPRYAAVRTLYHPGPGESTNVLDASALVLYLPAPKTVTGEDVLELHVHGGRATVRAVLSAIPKCPTVPAHVRYAEPGEFTRRAFLNDRLDLAQVESLSDALEAETEQQRRAAVRGSSGSLGRTYEGWRQQLLFARGEIEALIDFSEDQHLDDSPGELLARVTEGVVDIIAAIQTHELASQRNELLRNGIQIALLGPPNVGKSSLMNQVVGREASIVSGEAGTTRDIVEANLDIRGYLCTFADTAGFRSTTRAPGSESEPTELEIGAVELEGIRRARARALESDVVVALVSVEATSPGNYALSYDLETLKLAAAAQECLVVVNKCDSAPEAVLDSLIQDFKSSVMADVEKLRRLEPIRISCKAAQSGAASARDQGGIQAVADGLVSAFNSMTNLPSAMQDLHGVTERQRQLLGQCREHLESYLEKAEDDHEEDGALGDYSQHQIPLAAEDLRYAANCLARITGRGEAGDVEEVLGVIFEKFCVGK